MIKFSIDNFIISIKLLDILLLNQQILLNSMLNDTIQRYDQI